MSNYKWQFEDIYKSLTKMKPNTSHSKYGILWILYDVLVMDYGYPHVRYAHTKRSPVTF